MPYKPGMPETFLDVIDENDNPLYAATYTDVHQNGLLHRSVHVCVFRRPDLQEILMAQRSKTQRNNPGKYMPSAAGHPEAGQTREEGAYAELSEELFHETELPSGLVLVEFGRYRKETRPTDKELVSAHFVVYDGQFRPFPYEIEMVHWADTDRVLEDVQINPDLYGASFLHDMRVFREFRSKK